MTTLPRSTVPAVGPPPAAPGFQTLWQSVRTSLAQVHDTVFKAEGVFGGGDDDVAFHTGTAFGTLSGSSAAACGAVPSTSSSLASGPPSSALNRHLVKSYVDLHGAVHNECARHQPYAGQLYRELESFVAAELVRIRSAVPIMSKALDNEARWLQQAAKSSGRAADEAKKETTSASAQDSGKAVASKNVKPRRVPPWRSVSPPAAATPRERLEAFFAVYEAQKPASEIAELLQLYRGHEETLFESLVSHYGPEPPPRQPTAGVTALDPMPISVVDGSSEIGSLDRRARLRQFYAHHQVTKTDADIDRILRFFADRPDGDLFRVLVAKYGVEPNYVDATATNAQEEEVDGIDVLFATPPIPTFGSPQFETLSSKSSPLDNRNDIDFVARAPACWSSNPFLQRDAANPTRFVFAPIACSPIGRSGVAPRNAAAGAVRHDDGATATFADPQHPRAMTTVASWTKGSALELEQVLAVLASVSRAVATCSRYASIALKYVDSFYTRQKSVKSIREVYAHFMNVVFVQPVFSLCCRTILHANREVRCAAAALWRQALLSASPEVADEAAGLVSDSRRLQPFRREDDDDGGYGRAPVRRGFGDTGSRLGTKPLSITTLQYLVLREVRSLPEYRKLCTATRLVSELLVNRRSAGNPNQSADAGLGVLVQFDDSLRQPRQRIRNSIRRLEPHPLLSSDSDDEPHNTRARPLWRLPVDSGDDAVLPSRDASDSDDESADFVVVDTVTAKPSDELKRVFDLMVEAHAAIVAQDYAADVTDSILRQKLVATEATARPPFQSTVPFHLDKKRSAHDGDDDGGGGHEEDLETADFYRLLSARRLFARYLRFVYENERDAMTRVTGWGTGERLETVKKLLFEGFFGGQGRIVIDVMSHPSEGIHAALRKRQYGRLRDTLSLLVDASSAAKEDPAAVYGAATTTVAELRPPAATRATNDDNLPIVRWDLDPSISRERRVTALWRTRRRIAAAAPPAPPPAADDGATPAPSTLSRALIAARDFVGRVVRDWVVAEGNQVFAPAFYAALQAESDGGVITNLPLPPAFGTPEVAPGTPAARPLRKHPSTSFLLATVEGLLEVIADCRHVIDIKALTTPSISISAYSATTLSSSTASRFGGWLQRDWRADPILRTTLGNAVNKGIVQVTERFVTTFCHIDEQQNTDGMGGEGPAAADKSAVAGADCEAALSGLAALLARFVDEVFKQYQTDKATTASVNGAAAAVGSLPHRSAVAAALQLTPGAAAPTFAFDAARAVERWIVAVKENESHLVDTFFNSSCSSDDDNQQPPARSAVFHNGGRNSLAAGSDDDDDEGGIGTTGVGRGYGTTKKRRTIAPASPSLADVVVVLLNQCRDKDAFQHIHAGSLAKRLFNLIGNKSPFADDCREQESRFLGVLKRHVAYNYISRMEGMLRDASQELTTLGQVVLSAKAMQALSNLRTTTYSPSAEAAAAGPPASCKVPNKFGPKPTTTVAENGEGANEQVDLNDLPLSSCLTVLSAQAWPSMRIDRFHPPSELNEVLCLFQAHYSSEHQGRRLTWIHTLSSATISLSLPKGSKEVLGNVYHAAVLITLQKHRGTMMTLLDLAAELQLDVAQLRHVMAPMCLAKGYQIIDGRLPPPSTTGGEEAANGTAGRGEGGGAYNLLPPAARKSKLDEFVFCLNSQFTHKLRKFKLPVALKQPTTSAEGGSGESWAGGGVGGSSPTSSSPTDVSEQQQRQKELTEQRNVQLDAAIVRILKSRRTLPFAEIYDLCAVQLQSYFCPTTKHVRERLEALIAREYCTRDEGRPDIFHFLAL